MIDLQNLADLRIALVETRAQLRDAEQRLSVTRAIAEHDAIEDNYAALVAVSAGKTVDRAKALGSNETERARSLILALDADPHYQAALREHSRLQKDCELYAAAIANREDDIRERNRQTRQSLVDLLAGRNLDDALAEASERRVVLATFGEH